MMDPIRNQSSEQRGSERETPQVASHSREGLDPRLALIDSLLDKLFRLTNCWGLSPGKVAERVFAAANRASSEVSVGRAKESARSYAEVHAVGETLRVWFQDPDFMDESGNPRRLSMSGPHPNFTDLAERATRGISVQSVLEELIATGAVTRDSSGEIGVSSRLVACDGAWRRAEVGLYAADNLLASVERNIEDPRVKDALQCETVSLTFDRSQLPRIARHLRQQSMGFLEQTDDWLHQHSVRGSRRRDDAATVAVGLYITVRDSDQQ